MQKQSNLVLKIALTLTTLILTTTKPAFAQTGNQSDSTGPIPTTSDIAGGATPTNQTQGGSETVFQGGVSVQAAVNQAAATVVSELSTNSLTGTTPIPAATQQAVLSLLTATNTTETAASITTALTSCSKGQQLTPCPGSPSVAVAQNLTSSLAGLLAAGKVSPEKLKTAIRAYNAMILASNTEFLNNPPAELIAIRVSLSRLIAAAGRS